MQAILFISGTMMVLANVDVNVESFNMTHIGAVGNT
jgi:hypothetical protein